MSNSKHLTIEQRQVWVDALRSGKYNQTHGIFRAPGNYHCCLSVLSDACQFGARYTYGMHEILPRDICDKYVCLNDGEKFNFFQIADIVEKDDSLLGPNMETSCQISTH